MDGLDRAAVVRRLVALEETGRLGVEQVELAAGGLGVSSRTVWRWVRQARAGEGLGRRPRGRFLVTDEIRQRLAATRSPAGKRKLKRTASGILSPNLQAPQHR